MILKKFQVTNYKSVDDSGEVKASDITCLVGKNEAGKSALLEALAKLNPIGLHSDSFKLEDFPRKRLSSYKKRHDAEPATAITAWFDLSKDEQEQISDEFGHGAMTSTEVIVSMGYDNRQNWRLESNETAHVAHLIKSSGIQSDICERLRTTTTRTQLAEKLDQLDLSSEKIDALRQHLLATDDLETQITEVLSLPEFFYFSDYSTLPSEFGLGKLKAEMARAEQDAATTSIRALIHLVGANVDEFLQRANFERLTADLEAASNEISDQIFKYWSQNRHLEVRFQLQPVLDSQQRLHDTQMHIRIYNQLHRVTVPFGQRSRGFVWFFSFLVAFSAYKDRSNVILLLDEPGLNLHAKAQEDLLRYLENELAPHRQVLYTTHSPFMIDSRRLDRVRTVEDKSYDDSSSLEGTRVGNDPLYSSPDTLFPMQAALGYELAQTLFLGPNALLVEGPSDVIYLHTAQVLLDEAGRQSLDSRWVLVPVGGADKVATFVALLGANQLNVAALLDVCNQDRQRMDNLIKRGLLTRRSLFTFGDVLHRENADIEDMFEIDDYLGLVSAAYSRELKGTSLSDAELGPGNPRVVRRLEHHFTAASGRFSHYRPAQYLLQNHDLQTKLYSPPTLDRFEALFERVNSAIQT